MPPKKRPIKRPDDVVIVELLRHNRWTYLCHCRRDHVVTHVIAARLGRQHEWRVR